MSSQLQLMGEREQGQDVRSQNVIAVTTVANVVKSSLGPVGLDKMLVDDIGDVTITNDGATILKLLEVQHPAAKILVELAELQDQEVGDGTTSAVLVAAELLRRANELVRNKIHSTSVIAGYRQAAKESRKFIEEKLATKVEDLPKDALINCAKTSMSSKIVGADSDYFGEMVVEAIQAVKTPSAADPSKFKYPVRAVNVLKAHGASARESRLIHGYALNMARAAEGMPTFIGNGIKIACLDMDLQKTKMQFGVQVLVTDPKELEKIRDRESEITKERIQKILAAGANVILTSRGIDDMSLKYFVEAGAIALRRVPKDDLKRISKATGAQIISTLADMEGDETFETSYLGEAEQIYEEQVADDNMTIIQGGKTTSAVTLLLRGANDHMLDEMDRSIHDALCAVKRVLESGYVVPGGGAVEAALSIHLETMAESLGSREQLAITEFAQSLLVIPKTLAVNAAVDATELVAKLRAFHNAAQTIPEKANLARYGLDLINGDVVDMVQLGVMEPSISKTKIVSFAMESAITILRIDDMVKLVKDPDEEIPEE
eukprot:TRINITY_DN4385_c0_g2_i1.p1 TRINITY_DN4385_c0_g2~~TRINITY_DN4385_c0_g2_i1.p1  ORF type:complete len:548 (+),score=97.98 TRINITY_DN4385_c0_g2_i1:73-1716(+)